MDHFHHGRVVFTFSVCPLLHEPALLPEMPAKGSLVHSGEATAA